MPTVAETARITTTAPAASGIEQNAWLLWKSVVAECERRHLPKVDGHFTYNGALRTFVMRMWGHMDSEARLQLEREVYTYLRRTKQAICVDRVSPPTWLITTSWDVDSTSAGPVKFYQQSRAEKRVTAEEAGEHLPPGEVTIRYATTKEGTEVTVTTTPEVTETDARRALVIELLDNHNEPLVAYEVAHAIGVEVSTIRKDLKALLDDNKITCRIETTDERQIRFGGSPAKATRANLFSTRSPVPERVSHEVIDGYAKEPTTLDHHMPTDEVAWRLGKYFAKIGASTRFTSTTASERSQVNIDTLRHRLRRLSLAGHIVKAGHIKGCQAYRIKDREKILEFFGYANGAAAQLELSEPPTETAQPVPDGSPDPQVLINKVLDENERLRARVRKLEAHIEEMNRPKIDTETEQRLLGWTPFE